MYKLLIVDDENETRKALCDYFPWKEHGFIVVEQLENGKQALDYLEQNSVDVVLSDIKMPVMSGIALAQVLSRRKSGISVILLSGHTEFEYARQALVYGVKDYIVKPANYTEIACVFDRLKEEMDVKSESSQAGTAVFKPMTADSDYYQKVIETVKNYVTEHFRDAQLRDAANLVHFNPNYLSQFFKLNTGEYFSDYVMSVRMEKAAELLKEIGSKIHDISEAIGYANPQNFTRTFKAYFGVSPYQFRHGSKGYPNEE